jgi:excinuclease UvrABC nuclease subunit
VDLSTIFATHTEIPSPGKPIDPKTIPSHGGVFSFADAASTPILTISAQNMRRTVIGRLENPDPDQNRRRVDLRAITRRIWWTPAYSTFESNFIYLELARRLMPDTYRKNLAFGPVWFAGVNVEDRFPRWRTDKHAYTGDGVDIGPFVTRKRCTEFIDELEDIFDLCRYHDVLRQAPNGVACAYFDMGKCPAPCDGTVTLDDYGRSIADSVAFARDRSHGRIDEIEEQMKQAAEARDYPKAARFRQTLERVRELLRRNDRFNATPEQFRYLVVQRDERRSKVKPFFVDRGDIETGPSVALKDVERAVPSWTEKMLQTPDVPRNDHRVRSERVWLVSHFLGKGERAPGVFLHASQLGATDKVVDAIRARFATPNKRQTP